MCTKKMGFGDEMEKQLNENVPTVFSVKQLNFSTIWASLKIENAMSSRTNIITLEYITKHNPLLSYAPWTAPEFS